MWIANAKDTDDFNDSKDTNDARNANDISRDTRTGNGQINNFLRGQQCAKYGSICWGKRRMTDSLRQVQIPTTTIAFLVWYFYSANAQYLVMSVWNACNRPFRRVVDIVSVTIALSGKLSIIQCVLRAVCP